MKKTIKLSWNDVVRLSKSLVKKIRAARFRPNCIIGITVSGLVPLVLVAEGFKTKDVATVSARSYSKQRQGKLRITALPKINLRGKRVLLVDEIADKGTTLNHIKKVMRRTYGVKDVRTAVLVVNEKNCLHKPDYHVLEVGRWVVFPWDK